MIEFAVIYQRQILALTEVDDASWTKINDRGKAVNGVPVYCRKLPDGSLEVWPRCLPAYQVVRLVPVETTYGMDAKRE